jgi:hypothetical protein
VNEITTLRLCINENKTPTATGQQPFTEGSEEVKNMTPRWTKLAGKLLVGVFMSLAISGCTSDQTMAPSNAVGDAIYAIAPGDQVQFAARVRTTDQSRLMLTFVGRLDTVIAAQNCQIVRLNNGQDTPIPFSEIHPGDSVAVHGNYQQNQNVIASRLQLCIGDPVQFGARVATKQMDQSRQMLTFLGRPDTVLAARNCRIVRLNNGQDTPIPFSEIHPGDSVNVQGNRQQGQNVTADRLQLCQDGSGNYDVGFRDTILTIDYANNSFTVKGRTEVITTDANTVIWGQIVFFQGPNALDDGSRERYQHQYEGLKNRGQHDTTLAFSDLAVGDVVEVKANVVTPGILLACAIKIANCGQHPCLEFRSYLSSVDLAAKTVTFTDQAWIGWVCQGAKLTGLSGEPLTLADFASGNFVRVKGYVTTGDTLKVCQMSKETP